MSTSWAIRHSPAHGMVWYGMAQHNHTQGTHELNMLTQSGSCAEAEPLPRHPARDDEVLAALQRMAQAGVRGPRCPGYTKGTNYV